MGAGQQPAVTRPGLLRYRRVFWRIRRSPARHRLRPSHRSCRRADAASRCKGSMQGRDQPRARISRALSRCQSRAAIAARLSCFLRPSATPSSTLARPRSLKWISHRHDGQRPRGRWCRSARRICFLLEQQLARRASARTVRRYAALVFRDGAVEQPHLRLPAPRPRPRSSVARPARSDFTSGPTSCMPASMVLLDGVVVAGPAVLRGDAVRDQALFLGFSHARLIAAAPPIPSPRAPASAPARRPGPAAGGRNRRYCRAGWRHI